MTRPYCTTKTRRRHQLTRSAGRALWNLGWVFPRSFHLDACELYNLAPLFNSSVMNLPNALGAIGISAPPKAARCALIVGVASPALISLLSVSTISVGVFLGAPIPAQKLVS